MAQSSGIKARAKSDGKDTVSFIKSFVDSDSFIETDTLIASLTPLGEAVGEGVVGGFVRIVLYGVVRVRRIGAGKVHGQHFRTARQSVLRRERFV